MNTTRKARASELDYAVAVIINGYGINYMIHMIPNEYDIIHMLRIIYHASLFTMWDIYMMTVLFTELQLIPR